jgi:hypothetical protein
MIIGDSPAQKNAPNKTPMEGASRKLSTFDKCFKVVKANLHLCWYKFNNEICFNVKFAKVSG